jgi:hypothetical protein
VRTTPLVGEKVWFGPRRFGWGLSPVSAEGVVLSVGTVLLTIALARRWPERRVLRNAPGVALLVVSILKGTSPGGPRARATLRAARAGEDASAA